MLSVCARELTQVRCSPCCRLLPAAAAVVVVLAVGGDGGDMVVRCLRSVWLSVWCAPPVQVNLQQINGSPAPPQLN